MCLVSLVPTAVHLWPSCLLPVPLAQPQSLVLLAAEFSRKPNSKNSGEHPFLNMEKL